MRRLISLTLALGVFVLLGCSSGPGSAPGPELYYSDAKKNLVTLDYEAALKNLDRLVKSGEGQPLARQGAIVRTALLTAMAEGSKQMGDAYRDGSTEPAAGPYKSQFTRMKADYYGITRVRLMNAMETVLAQRAKLGDQTMPLDLAFPDFTGQEHAAVTKVRNGRLPSDADRYRAEMENVRNALARTLAFLVGVGDNVAKGKTVFEKGGVQIDPRVYLIELSERFLKLSDVFDRRALDDPPNRRITLEVVRDNLDLAAKMLEAKPDKDLEARVKKLKADCEKALKALP